MRFAGDQGTAWITSAVYLVSGSASQKMAEPQWQMKLDAFRGIDSANPSSGQQGKMILGARKIFLLVWGFQGCFL